LIYGHLKKEGTKQISRLEVFRMYKGWSTALFDALFTPNTAG